MRIWKFLKEPNNRGALQLILTFTSLSIASIWAVYNYTNKSVESPVDKIETQNNLTFNNYTFKEIPKEFSSKKITNTNTNTNEDALEFTQLASCTSVHHDVLRYGNDYRFNQKINAQDNLGVHYIGGIEFKYFEEADFNGSKAFPRFEFTKKLLDAQGYIYPKDNYKYLEADSVYTIRYVPHKRQSTNLVLMISNSDFEYFEQTSTWKKYDNITCINYEISWCGDGFVEEEYGEECDPKAEPHNNTCNSSTCKIKIKS